MNSMLDSGRKQARLSKIKILKAISIQGECLFREVLTLADLDLCIKTTWRQPHYGLGRLMKIQK